MSSVGRVSGLLAAWWCIGSAGVAAAQEKFERQSKVGELKLTIEGPVEGKLVEVAQDLRKLYYECYPKLLKRFEHPDRKAPRAIRIVFVPGLRVPAQCSGDKIEVSVEWLRDHPHDTPLLTHELTHSVQRYPRRVPGWMTEGIADYARKLYGPEKQKDWSLPWALSEKQSYKDSYRVTARFLEWLDQRTPGAVDKLHRNLQDGRFQIGDFQTIAGKPVDELWKECVADLDKQSKGSGKVRNKAEKSK